MLRTLFTMPRGGLWQNSDFLRLWSGQTVSEFGSWLGVMPLVAILVLNATPVQLGFISMLGALPALLLSLFVGVLVDRVRRLPVLITADLVRFLLLMLLCTLALLDLLGMWVIYVVVFVAGSFTLAFDVANRSYLPTLVASNQLVDANSKLSATSSVAEVASPAMGGFLVQVFSASFVLFIDALSFLVSAICLGRIKTRELPPMTEERANFPDMLSGLQFVWADRSLRIVVLAAGVQFFFGGFFATLYAYFVLRVLELGPILLGIFIGAGGVGALFGATLVRRLNERFGLRRVLTFSLWCAAPLGFLVPVSALVERDLAIGIMLTNQLVGDVAFAIFLINQLSLRQSLTPHKLLGRMNASYEFVVGGLGALGMLIGGLTGELWGATEALFVAVTGFLVAALVIYRLPRA